MLREATVCFLRGRFILPRNSFNVKQPPIRQLL